MRNSLEYRSGNKLLSTLKHQTVHNRESFSVFTNVPRKLTLHCDFRSGISKKIISSAKSFESYSEGFLRLQLKSRNLEDFEEENNLFK